MIKYIPLLDNYKKIILIVSTFFVVVGTIYGFHMGIFTDQEKMKVFMEQWGVLAPLVFVFLQAIQVVVPILPGAVGCVYGVVFFGVVGGFVLNYVGICLGSIWTFLIARSLGRDFVQKITGEKFYDKYSAFLMKENRFEKLFAFLIFLPVAPDDFLCYLAGVSKMTLKKFTVIILLGKPMAIFLYSMGLNQVFKALLNFAA
ncbi:MAG: TVP38/TMEM64 family protein [Lachnospiraceae bacterium]